jgi:adenylate cyclase
MVFPNQAVKVRGEPKTFDEVADSGKSVNREGRHVWRAISEHATHWVVGGVLLAATGFAPEEWFAQTVHGLHIPESVLHLWTVGVDVRVIPIAVGMAIIAIGVLRQRQGVRLTTSSGPALPSMASVGAPTVDADSAQNAVGLAIVQDKPEALPLPDKPSIAVLPFDNLSGDPAQEYFSDGVAEDIITELSRSRALFVIARNSSFTYRARSVDVKQIGRELGIRYVLEGSVRRESERIRVTAQLIDAETDHHVWAERYDRNLRDIFAIQDEITIAVARAIEPAIADAERARALRNPPNCLSTWEAYQRGLSHLVRFNPADNLQARSFFERAVELDPNFASPCVGLAFSYMNEGYFFALRSLTEAVTLGETWARRATGLDANDADAQAALAFSMHFKGDHDAALEGALRALAINPNSALANQLKGICLLFTGQVAEGRAALLSSLRLSPRDPLSGNAHVLIVVSYYYERDYIHAVQAGRDVLAVHPDNPIAYRWIAAVLGQLGRVDEAKLALQKAYAMDPAVFNLHVRARPPWMSREHHEHMLEGIRKAGWEGQ